MKEVKFVFRTQIIWMLLIFVSQISLAQQVIIKGRVIDAQSETPIPLSSISFPSINEHMLSDSLGEFRLSLSKKFEGILACKVSFPGYSTAHFQFNIKASDTTLTLTLPLQSQTLQSVTISDRQTGLDSRSPFNTTKINVSNTSFTGNPAGLMGHINREPGVYGAELGQGIVKPFIRGLGFSRVVSIYQHNKLENHQWGADHGLGLSDLGIGEMKIIKGPASVLYGSGAVGGVLIAKDDESHLAKTGWSGVVGKSFQSVSLGIRPFASLAYTSPKRYFFRADVAYESHADYKDGNNRIIGNSRFETRSIRLHTGKDGIRFKNKLSFTYHTQRLGIIDENEMTDSLSLATYRRDRTFQAPLQSVSDALLSYTQEHKIGKWDAYLALSQHLNNRNELEENILDIDLGLLQWHTFLSGRLSKTDKKGFTHNLGIQGSYISTQNKENAAEILMPDAKTKEGGVFYMISKSHNKQFYQAALRYDYRNVVADASAPVIRNAGFILPGSPSDFRLGTSFGGLTSSIGITHIINGAHSLKFNISGGFRAPDLSELFSNGNHPGTNRFEKGNVDFNREQNIQAEASWLYKSKSIHAEGTVFSSQLFNYISFINSGELTPNNWEIWQFIQQNAWLYGIEGRVRYSFEDMGKSQISASASVIRARESVSRIPLTFIPPDNARVQISTHLNHIKQSRLRLSAEIMAIATHDRPGFGELNTPGYTIANLQIERLFTLASKKQIRASIRIMNLTNEKVIDHMSMLRAFHVSSTGRNIALNMLYLF